MLSSLSMDIKLSLVERNSDVSAIPIKMQLITGFVRNSSASLLTERFSPNQQRGECIGE